MECLWEPAETRDEKAHVEMIALKVEKLKIPLEMAWEEAGYSQEQIQRMLETEVYQARQSMRELAKVGLGAMSGQGDKETRGQGDGETRGGGSGVAHGPLSLPLWPFAPPPPASCFLLPASCFLLLASCFLFLASDVLRPHSDACPLPYAHTTIHSHTFSLPYSHTDSFPHACPHAHADPRADA